MELRLTRKDFLAENAMAQATWTANSWMSLERSLMKRSPLTLLRPSKDLWLTILAREPRISKLKYIEILSVTFVKLHLSLELDTSVAWDQISTFVKNARQQILNPILFWRSEETIKLQLSSNALMIILIKRCSLTRASKFLWTNHKSERAKSSILKTVLHPRRDQLRRKSSTMLDLSKRTSEINSLWDLFRNSWKNGLSETVVRLNGLKMLCSFKLMVMIFKPIPLLSMAPSSLTKKSQSLSN